MALWIRAHFFGLSRSERDRKVNEILQTVALSTEYAERLPQQLSGGERQRVAVGARSSWIQR